VSHEDDVIEALKAHSISQMVAERAAKDPEYAEYIREVRTILKPILDDLLKIGYKVEWLSDLRSHKEAWKASIPVLLHWLPSVSHLKVRWEIIGLLGTSWTGNRATKYLIEEFRKTALSHPYYAWTIGNTLSTVDVKGFEKEIISLARHSQYGIARQMLVMGLHRLHNSEAAEAALDLLNDEDVKVHAIIALGKMKSKRALFHLEKLLTDNKPLIRKEARKAITKIMR
jgi:hypothetical protein